MKKQGDGTIGHHCWHQSYHSWSIFPLSHKLGQKRPSQTISSSLEICDTINNNGSTDVLWIFKDNTKFKFTLILAIYSNILSLMKFPNLFKTFQRRNSTKHSLLIHVLKGIIFNIFLTLMHVHIVFYETWAAG